MDIIIIILGFFITLLIGYNIILFFIKSDLKNNKIPNYEEMLNTLNLKIDNLEKKVDDLKGND